MQAGSPDKPEKKKTSLLKLILIGFLGFFLFLGIASFLFLAPILGPIIFPSSWNQKMSQAKELWEQDRRKAELLMKEAIKKAEDAKIPVAEQMQLHRDYANALYNSSEWKAGDEQIEAAIGICPKPPAPKSNEADQLTHAYQDRGWNAFYRRLDDSKLPSGSLDQEKSVEVADKAFGPEHEQTIYKLPSLALMYGVEGQKEKAQSTMQRALDGIKKDSARQCSWYVLLCDARLKVVEHKYRESVKSFLEALNFSKNDEGHRDRIWDDYTADLRRQETKPHPELKQLRSLFDNGKFEELDKIAQKLQKEAKINADGSWVLDTYFNTMLESNDLSDRDYQQRIFDIKSWLKQHPDSAIARISLAETLISYAWFARGSGYSNTVTEQGWKDFAARLDQAKAALDADPRINSKCPRAYPKYAKIALGQGMEKEKFMELVNACHKDWPHYFTIDQSATYFLLPRWHGEPGDVESFIKSRADDFKGMEGDLVYAQLVWYIKRYLDAPFTPKSSIKWERVKAGFKEMFKEFPSYMEGRVAFIELCRQANDLAEVESAFEGFPLEAN